MSPIRRNEQMNMIRREPQAYVCEYDASFNPEYEAWADPGSVTTDAVWIASKHTYDGDNNLTKTEWAQDSNGLTAGFTNQADSLSTLTYV